MQGTLTQLAEQPLSLSIIFPDNSTRLFAQNVFGEQDLCLNLNTMARPLSLFQTMAKHIKQ
ncbi:MULTISPECIES: hypothetical protein [unclassified Mannheimia]|uniref:hypothetical protein n=1 Tax=unclassified Mannheimia TaxID=2645054 RepID=UPI00359D3DDA